MAEAVLDIIREVVYYICMVSFERRHDIELNHLMVMEAPMVCPRRIGGNAITSNLKSSPYDLSRSLQT